MEVVLLWLDDLDDVLFSVALAWERLRRVVLTDRPCAAFALAASRAVRDRDSVGSRLRRTSPRRASRPGSPAPSCARSTIGSRAATSRA